MKNILKYILSAVFLFAAVPTINAADMNMAGMEEIKKKKKVRKRKLEKKERNLKKVFSLRFLGASK